MGQSSQGDDSGPEPAQPWPLAPEGRVVIEVQCQTAEAEVVADRLLMLGASAVAEASAGRLVADLEPAAVAGFERWLAEWSPASTLSPLEVDPAWVESWRDHARVVRAGRVVVRPAWIDEPPDAADLVGGDVVEVVVDPHSTFGSGSHETTRLCLSLLGDLVVGGEAVLDVGVGSGVLAVAALRLGAGRADGVDIDTAARWESTRCAELNGCGDRYRFRGEALDDTDGPYDLVVANLLVAAIEQIGARLTDAVRPQGLLVLSGLLEAQVDRALAAVGAGAGDVVGRRSEGGWAAVALRRSGRP